MGWWPDPIEQVIVLQITITIDKKKLLFCGDTFKLIDGQLTKIILEFFQTNGNKVEMVSENVKRVWDRCVSRKVILATGTNLNEWLESTEVVRRNQNPRAEQTSATKPERWLMGSGNTDRISKPDEEQD